MPMCVVDNWFEPAGPRGFGSGEKNVDCELEDVGLGQGEGRIERHQNDR